MWGIVELYHIIRNFLKNNIISDIKKSVYKKKKCSSILGMKKWYFDSIFPWKIQYKVQLKKRQKIEKLKLLSCVIVVYK